MRIMLLDIDGCILDPVDRIKFLVEDNDAEKYEALWRLDKPIQKGVEIYHALMASGIARPIFNTARREAQRESTMTQLTELFGYEDFDLWMRPNDSNTRTLPAWQLKTEQVFIKHKFKPDDIQVVFDDEDKVIKAFRAAGVLAYQTAFYEEHK